MTLNTELLLHAMKDLGVREYLGKKINPRIRAMYKLSVGWSPSDDATPWCAAAMGAWCEELELPHPRSLRARAWLDEIELPLGMGLYRYEDPSALEQGDIVVLSRGDNPRQGHVALYTGSRTQIHLYLYGGNQRNHVCDGRYSVRRFLQGIRFVPASEADCVGLK